jgi:hypothetical protein
MQNSKPRIALLVILILYFGVLTPFLVQAQEGPQFSQGQLSQISSAPLSLPEAGATGEAMASLAAEPSLSPKYFLLEEIQRARSFLQQEVDQEKELERLKKQKPTIVKSKNIPLKVTLALWQEEAKSLEFLKIKKTKSSVVPLSHNRYKIKVRLDNGVNSEFEIVGEPKLHVLAVKYPIFVSLGKKNNPPYRLENVVYTPYTDFLATPEIIKAGEEFLNSRVNAVYQELKNLGLRSLAFPGHFLADVIPPELVGAIIAIEHVNGPNLRKFGVDQYLKNFYTILATNGVAAYAYARSTQSASGLVQFIPATYKKLLKLRPDLILDPNFDYAMRDPALAIKAQVGFLDYNLTLLPKNALEKYESNARLLGAYLAAMYNGGPVRVRRAIARWGEGWADDHQKQGGKSTSLKRETIQYVKNYELVYDHFASSLFESSSLFQPGP